MVERTEALFIGGRSGVGKTSVGTELHRQLSLSAITHCLIEGDNLDLAFPVPSEQGLQIAELNLAAMWANYRTAGYLRLIYTNTASVRADVLDDLVQALDDDPVVRAVLLTANDAVAEARLREREIGSAFDWHLARSRETAQELDEKAPDWVWRINTDNAGVSEITHEIITRLGWTPRR